MQNLKMTFNLNKILHFNCFEHKLILSNVFSLIQVVKYNCNIVLQA
jgi:hypothetical protein